MPLSQDDFICSSERDFHVGIIGAGFAGVYTALNIAKAHPDYKVLLIEANSEILSGSSYNECYKLHTGLHYAGDAETAVKCLKDTINFLREYPKCVLGEPNEPWRKGRHYVMSNSLYTASEVRAVALRLQETYKALVEKDIRNKVLGEPGDFIRELNPDEYDYVAKNIPVERGGVETSERVVLAYETPESQIDFQTTKAMLVEELARLPNITLATNCKVIQLGRSSSSLDYTINIVYTKKNADCGKRKEVVTSSIINCAWDKVEALDAQLGFFVPSYQNTISDSSEQPGRLSVDSSASIDSAVSAVSERKELLLQARITSIDNDSLPSSATSSISSGMTNFREEEDDEDTEFNYVDYYENAFSFTFSLNKPTKAQYYVISLEVGKIWVSIEKSKAEVVFCPIKSYVENIVASSGKKAPDDYLQKYFNSFIRSYLSVDNEAVFKEASIDARAKVLTSSKEVLNRILAHDFDDVSYENETSNLRDKKSRFEKTIRPKVMLLVKLPEALKRMNTCIFSIGDHASITNLGDGKAILTYEPVTNIGSFSPLEKIFLTQPKLYSLLAEKLTPDSGYGHELAQKMIKGVAKYIPLLANSVVEEIRLGYVKVFDSKDNCSINDRNSAIHSRKTMGIELQALCYFSFSGMKMSYTISGAREITKALELQLKRKEMCMGWLQDYQIEVSRLIQEYVSANKIDESKRKTLGNVIWSIMLYNFWLQEVCHQLFMQSISPESSLSSADSKFIKSASCIAKTFWSRYEDKKELHKELKRHYHKTEVQKAVRSINKEIESEQPQLVVNRIRT